MGVRERRQLLPLIGVSHLVLNEQEQTVRFDRAGMSVDLGGIAKGWAVDRAAAVLRRHGIRSALISAGTSTLYALGSPPGQSAWSIGIRHPLREDEIFATASLKDESLSTSASYENFLRIDGKMYSHILDPHSGVPVERMLSCTVMAPTAVASDALSTAGFVLGIDGTVALLERLGLAGVLVGPGKRGTEIVVRRIGLPREPRAFLGQMWKEEPR